MAYTLDSKLADAYSQKELFKVLDSFKSLTFDIRILLFSFIYRII